MYISNECAIFFTRLFRDMREHSNADGLYSLRLIVHVSVNFFLLLFSRELYCMLTAFSLKRNTLEVFVSPPAPTAASSGQRWSARWRRCSSYPDSLFLHSFSPPPRATQTFFPLHQPALSHLLLPSPPPLLLLPTGPHENTYFTGIHDGRRASVQTCLPGLPSDRLAFWALDRAAGPALTCLFSFCTFSFLYF